MRQAKYMKVLCKVCHSDFKVPNPRWLRQVRKLSGIQQKDLARKAGVLPAYICDIELGRKRCRNKRVLRMYETINKKIQKITKK